MIPGVDSYSYHRFFGEIRTGESDPGQRWTQLDLLDEVVDLGSRLVSLETCYFPDSAGFWDELAEALDERDLDCAVAWGAPRGLRRGTDWEAARDLMATVPRVARLGATELRIVLGGPADLSVEPERDVLDRVVPLLVDVVSEADGHGVRISVETHCDLTLGAVEQLMDRMAGRLGIVLDTANVVRIGSDLLDATRRLSPFIRMLHLKDVILSEADLGDPGGWWPCVALGSGDLDVAGMLAVLRQEGFEGPACVEVADVRPGDSERQIVRDGLGWLRTELSVQ